MTYLLLLLLILTALAWIFYKWGILKSCPVCAAALLTWGIGLTAFYLGASWADPLFIALLMGMTVGALAEKFGNRFGFVWKTFFVLFCSAGIYFLFEKEPVKAGILLSAVVLATLFFLSSFPSARGLVDKFNDCC